MRIKVSVDGKTTLKASTGATVAQDLEEVKRHLLEACDKGIIPMDWTALTVVIVREQ